MLDVGDTQLNEAYSLPTGSTWPGERQTMQEVKEAFSVEETVSGKLGGKGVMGGRTSMCQSTKANWF